MGYDIKWGVCERVWVSRCARSSFKFLKCPRSSVLSADSSSCPQIGTSDSCPNFPGASPSAASDCLPGRVAPARALPNGLSGRSPASAHSDPGTRAGPTWVGPRRDKPGHGITVATPVGRDPARPGEEELSSPLLVGTILSKNDGDSSLNF